jgi:hypothetical protein
MAEVNEEILEQYLKIVKKWFYVGDIPFAVPHNYSNIDVLGYDPKNKKYYDFEVKFRSAFSLTNDGKAIYYLVEQFTKYKDQRERKIREYIGANKTTKVVVTTHKMMGKSTAKRTNMEADFKKIMKSEGFPSEVWYFDEMIPLLVENVQESGRYNTQLLQTIRMLKTYSDIQ